MAIPIDQPQFSVQNLLPPGGTAQLGPTGQRMIGEIGAFRAGEPSSIDANDWAFFESMYKGSQGLDSRFNLSDLPPEVAQMLLGSQAKTMEQFFDAWAKSIEENAKADREAPDRAQVNDQLGKPIDVRRQKRLLVSALNYAVNASMVDPMRPEGQRLDSSTARRILDDHGLSIFNSILPTATADPPKRGQVLDDAFLPTTDKAGFQT